MATLGITASGTIDPGPDWDRILQRLEQTRQNDIYFDHRYVALYTKAPSRATAFHFERAGDLFFLPYIVRPIPGRDGLQDFETAYGYGGPLSNSRDPIFLREAWDEFRRHCRQERVVAGFLRFHPLLGNHILADPSEITPNRTTVLLDLNQPLEKIWAGYADSNRNKIRKAQRLGVTVTPSEEASALKCFYALYTERMRELGADEIYGFDDDYFAGVELLGAGRWRVYLARVGDTVIGGALIFLSRSYAHYHLSASPKRFQQYSANNILRHGVITSLIDSGLSQIHFGGGKTSSADDALLRFKKTFSPQEAVFFTGRFIAEPKAYGDLCADWERAHPERAETSRNIALRYRLKD